MEQQTDQVNKVYYSIYDSGHFLSGFRTKKFLWQQERKRGQLSSLDDTW